MEDILMEIIESAKVEALDELCCTICESSEDGCGANDLSESEYWEMKAEVHFGLQIKQY